MNFPIVMYHFYLYPLSGIWVYLIILLTTFLVRILSIIQLNREINKEEKPSEGFNSVWDKVISAILDWLSVLGSNWYLLFGLCLMAYLLCYTQVGIDITEYMIEKRSGRNYMSNVLYLIMLYFTSFIWAIANWITPQYDMTQREIKPLHNEIQKTGHRILGAAVFFIVCMSLGLAGNAADDNSYPVWYIAFIALYFALLAKLVLSDFTKGLQNPTTQKLDDGQLMVHDKRIIPKPFYWWTFSVVVVNVIMVLFIGSFITTYNDIPIKLLGNIIGLSFLPFGVLFWILALWFDTYLSDKEMVFRQTDRSMRQLFWRFAIKVTNWSGRKKIKGGYYKREIIYCLAYRLVVGIGFFVAVIMTFAPNIQPFHPFFVMTSGISFFLILIDLLYFANYKKHLYFLSLGKTGWVGKSAQVGVFIISVFLLVCLFFINSDFHYNPLLSKSVTNRESIGDAFKNWVDTDSTFIDALPEGAEYPLFILAGQGGGSRAAYWMGQTLMNLDAYTDGVFKRHCFAVSAVSGSAPGTAAVLAYWKKYEKTPPDFVLRSVFIKNIFNKNFVSSGLAGNFFGDFFRKQIPTRWLPIKDRNQRLQEEEAWCVHRALYEPELVQEDLMYAFKDISGEAHREDSTWFFHQSFLSVYYDSLGQLKSRLPYLFTNTCNVQTGKRGIVSPVTVDPSVFVDVIDVLSPKGRRDTVINLTIGQSVNISELFPILSASASVDGFNYVDGGLYENYGLTTALEIFDACQKQLNNYQQNKDSRVARRFGKVKMYIVAVINAQWGMPPIQPVNQLFAPIEASYNAHFSGYSEKIRYDVQHRSDLPYSEIVFDRGVVPLTRVLTERNIKALDETLIVKLKNDTMIVSRLRRLYHMKE